MKNKKMQIIQTTHEHYCCAICGHVSEHKNILSCYIVDTGLDERLDPKFSVRIAYLKKGGMDF